MKKFSMQCTCGHTIEVEANDLEEAVGKIKGVMDEKAIEAHIAEKHAGEPVPTKEQSDMMVEKTTQEVAAL